MQYSGLIKENIKYKKLTKQQIIISLDRLTRFKITEDKYLRVFSDIILSNLITPKIKKSDLMNMDYSLIRDYATMIFNGSLNELSGDFSINTKLKEYENNVFKNSENVRLLLDNKLDFKSAIKLIDSSNNVKNLEWLNCLTKENIKDIRKRDKFLYPIEKVVIAEGITEEILLPVFADVYGYNFDENGIKVIAAGGKNQVVKLYYKLCEELNLPIFVLLDEDAHSNELSINSKLRAQDRVLLIKSGEFEDLLPKKLIIKTVNNEFKNFVKISSSDLDSDTPMVKILEELYKDKGLHEFKKAEFAQRVSEQVKTSTDLSEELVCIIKEISEF